MIVLDTAERIITFSSLIPVVRLIMGFPQNNNDNNVTLDWSDLMTYNVRRHHWWGEGWRKRHPFTTKMLVVLLLSGAAIGWLWFDHKLGNSTNPFRLKSWSEFKRQVNQ